MVNRETVTCEHVWREISNYLEGDVDVSLRAAMDEHFKSCAHCASVLAGTRNVIGLYGDERMMEVPAGFGRRLQRRLARSARISSRWSTWSAWLVPLAALTLLTGGLRLANSLARINPPLTRMAQPPHNIPPEMLVVVSADARVFHAPGCDFIHNKDSERTLTAKEAIREGYIPCLRCMRKYLKTDIVGANAPALGTQAAIDSDSDDEEAHGERR
jgi:hypothetical protein